MESEGPAEKYRAVIDGVIPEMNRSAQGGARSSLHFRDEGVLIHPPQALVKKVVFVAEVLPFVGQKFQLFR